MAAKPKPVAWKPAAAVMTLRREIDTLWKFRDKASDGIKGDDRHAATRSDHNPDPATGYVRALDIDADLRGTRRPDPAEAQRLALQLVNIGKRDERLAYVIHNGRIWSRSNHWNAKPYTGLNAHRHHIHISFTPAGDTNGQTFGVTK